MSESDESATHRGVVKWFNDAKGYGFIEHSDGKDVFVHYSVIESDGFKSLRDGEEVLYEFREGPKGLQAVKVSRTHRASANGDGSMIEDQSAQSSENTESTESDDFEARAAS